MKATDIMPKGMDDDAFNEEERHRHKAMMEEEERLDQIRQQQDAEWERQFEAND